MRAGRRKAWKTRLAFTAVIAALAAAVWLLPPFHLQAVDLALVQSLPAEAVLRASGLTSGQHLLHGLGGTLEQISQLRYPLAESSLAATFPRIRTAVVRMNFPGRISIQIEERLPVAYLAIPDGCVIIDKEGVALEILAAAPANIPVIEGITATSMILGQPLTVDAPSSLHGAISLTGAIIDADKDLRADVLLLPTISKIRPVGGRSLYLTLILPDSGEEFHVSAQTGEDLAADMLWLRFALSQGAFDQLGKGVLDLSGNRKTFIPDA